MYKVSFAGLDNHKKDLSVACTRWSAKVSKLKLVLANF